MRYLRFAGIRVSVASVDRLSHIARQCGYWDSVRDVIEQRVFEDLLYPYQRRTLEELRARSDTLRPK